MVEAYKKEADVTHILVFMDESYIHTTHFDKKGFYRKGPAGETNRTSSKGRRLIMMHAIMRDRPLRRGRTRINCLSSRKDRL